MFITQKYAGYNRNGEQSAAGYFLILLQPKIFESVKYPRYKLGCAICGRLQSEHTGIYLTDSCSQHGIVARIRQRARIQNEDATEDLIPEFVEGCPECESIAAQKAALGCQFFKSESNSYPIRAMVRYVRMRQCGHWMMGSARIAGQSLTLSGSYGSDGLPTSVSDEVYDMGVDVPSDLIEAWNTGGGWNGAGSEAAQMREWALKTFPNPAK